MWHLEHCGLPSPGVVRFERSVPDRARLRFRDVVSAEGGRQIEGMKLRVPHDALASKLSWERLRSTDHLGRGQKVSAAFVGGISGLLSWLWMMFGPNFGFDYVPVGPALIFWVSYCITLVDLKKSPIRAFLLLPAIYLAWYAALKVAMLSVGNPYKSDPNVLMCGLTGGFVGAVLTMFVSETLVPSTKGLRHVLPALSLGTISGATLSLNIPDGSRNPLNLGLALVFICWQASMLATLSFALSRNSVVIPMRQNVVAATKTGFSSVLVIGAYLIIYGTLAVISLAMRE